MTNFYFNLTEKLQGCSKQKGMVVCTSNPDGQPTVNRQSAMTLLSGKRSEKEQLSSTCLRSASDLPPFRSRYLRYAAMIFAVLVMSVANIGMAWADDPIKCTPTLISGGAITYEYTGGNKTSIKDKGLWVEVPSASAEGQISIMCGDNQASRYAYIYGTNGTVKDNDRKIVMQKTTYPDPIFFTSSDIKTDGGKYYLVFNTGDEFKYSQVKFTLFTKAKYTTSTFYPLYANTSKTAAQLVTAASFHSNIETNITNVGNASGFSSTVESPHDFKSNISSGTTYYYLAPNANTYTITLYGLSNVKSIRLYGNGSGGGRTYNVTVKKVSGSGSTFSVSSLTTGNAKTILEYTTGDMTGEDGYDANTYYTYTLSYTGNASYLWGIYVEAAPASGCSDWGFYYGTDGESDWDKTCFTYTGADNEWQITDFVIPDKPNWYVDNSTENDAKKVLSTWSNLYFALSQGSGSRPMVGNTATGAVGTMRIYNNSTWNNRYAGFIPDGYKLKFGSTEYAMSVEAGNEYRSEIVEYSSSTANNNVSVGIVDASGDYVATDNSEGMQHIFLNTGGDDLWSTESASNFGIFDVTNGNWTSLMVKVPGEDYLYEGWVPSTCTTVSFHRLASSTPKWKTNDEDGTNTNVWNSTGDKTLESGKNLFTISSFSDGSWSAYEKKGKFRMNADYTDKNWYVRFYPYNVLSYNANDGSGAPVAQSVAADGNSAARTVAVAAGSGMTAPTGYQFLGWNPNESQADAGTKDDSYDPSDNVELTGDVTLYAVWNCITPDAPTASAITATDGCGVAATFTAEIPSLPSYVTWYWQTSADGTSTSNPASTDYTTDTEAGSKTIYLRAENTECGTWSTAVSKSATVRTAVTATWSTAPADGTVGGSMTASVTTNYSTGLRFSSSDATVASVNETSGAISYLKAGTTTITATVTGAGSYCSTASVNKTITVTAAASQTALVANTLYEVPDMIPSGESLTNSDQFLAGLSENTKFEMIGVPASSSTPKVNNDTKNDKTIDEITFDDGSMWFKGNASLTSNIPTTYALSFIVPEGGGKLYLYFSGESTNIKLAKSGSEGSKPTLTDGYAAVDVTAGTYYLYGTGTDAPYCFYGLKLVVCTTPATAFGNGAYTVGGSALDLSTLISGKQGSGAITYTVKNANGTGATIAGSSFTATSAGTATVTATQAADATYCEKVMDATITVSAPAATLYTVTYAYNGATGGNGTASVMQASEDASVTLANPTRTGFEFDGWYKTDGTKVSSPYTPAADITLYARWQEACDAGSGEEGATKIIGFTTATCSQKASTGGERTLSNVSNLTVAHEIHDGGDGDDSLTVYTSADQTMYYGSNTKVYSRGGYRWIKGNSTLGNNTVGFSATVASGYQFTIDSISFGIGGTANFTYQVIIYQSDTLYKSPIRSVTNYSSNTSANHEFHVNGLSAQTKLQNLTGTFYVRVRVCQSSTGKYFYLPVFQVIGNLHESGGGGGGIGTCYHVYYKGNGADEGFVADTTSYADGEEVTVLDYDDSRYPLAKDGYEFRGWATSAGGSVAYSAGDKITIDGADVALHAVWVAESDALVTWTMSTNTATWSASSTSTTVGTNISTIATSRTAGGDGKYEGATAKVTMADAEVTGTAAPSNSANFTFTIAGGKQVEISKFDCQVFNVSSGNRTYKAQIFDAAGNVYNSTNTVAVSAEATLTDASFVFGSGKILRGAVTIRIYAWGSGSDFRMGPDVKFYGTVEDYVCATPAAPTISGVSEYVPGQDITLTASHDGTNYDNLTTYTWYKGANWTAASGTTPVQAAATGEGGYTLTIDDCTTGNAGLYWCKVSNGTGCDAHNSEGYNIIVYPTYTITYNLNGGDWGEVEHKDSYTQFDEDYTLPTPTKTGYVFAGWYGASDFSGLPTVVLGAGSVGDKEYYAKWGSEVTVSWTVTKVDDKLYRGGGGYSVKAVINETDWSTGFMDELELTATEGVTLKNIVASVVSNHVQVTADFDITTGLAADATEITFTLDVPADGTYGPKVDEHEEDLTSCAGSSTVWNFAYASDDRPTLTSSNASTEGNKNTLSATTGSGNLYYFAGSSDAFETDKYLKMNGASGSGSVNSRSVYQTRCFYIDITSNGTLTIQQYADNGNGAPKYVVANTRPLQSDYPSSSVAPTTTGGATYEINVTNYSSGTADRIWVAYPTAKAYIISVTWTPTGGGGTVTPTLSWTPALNTDADWDSGNNRLNKETGDPDFTFVANQNKNSLGAITYESSDPAVATVNAAGTVHIVGAAGDATITATLAASGCFEEATATYNIHVEDNCIDVPGTITSRDLGCDGTELTVSGHTATASVSYQWYKDGVSLGGSYTNPTCTVTVAGEYYVVVDNSAADGDHCAMASTNTIKVAAKAAATATKIVDSWYVKNGRRTPDIALVKTTNATGFTVTNGSSVVIWNSDSTVTTGFGGCGFHMDDNGIIYLNGTTDAGAATSGLTGGEDETLTITVSGCGSSASQTIIIHCQAATNYKEIAFVADGGKGMKKDSITVGHGDGTELYEYLDSVGTAAGNRLFQLSERNIYWTTDEKAIREEYSQFDAILITDDPSTNTVVKTGDDYKTKGYVNAFGTMVDVRPIFTMEAYVSALKNWGSKGIAGNPESPNPRQYEMRLECKDHEIYGAGLPDPSDGTNVWEETIGGETFRHVILVDSTKGVYKGVAYNAETAGNKKPALQGFTGEAAGSLLGLGRILEGTLQAAIERQEEPAARLLVMGINAKALQPTCALTNEGKAVIKNILTYLLKTNMEEVDDCSNYFTGKNSTSWSDPGNWSKESLPSTEAKVRILAPCVISGIQPHVLQVSIVNSGNSNIRNTARGSALCNGTLTIEPDGALIVDGKVLAAEAPHFAANDLMPTTPEMLTINTGSDGQAALIFNNDEGLTKATVNYYSLGRKIDGNYQYQYFAVPMEYVSVSPTFANENHGGTKIYTYVYNAGAGWTRRGYYDDLYAFEGLGLTTSSTADHMSYTMTGTLASTATQEISLSTAGDGYNLVGNSWMAPIQIAALSEDNTDANITKTAYIYCTGHDGGTGSTNTEGAETAGQWIPIPFAASGTEGWRSAGKLSVIPAMQAFQIKTAADATLTMDYSKVVRGSDNSLTERMRAPKRVAAHTGNEMTIIRVSDTKTYTDVCLFEGEQFSEAFDNGWEAEYMEGDGRSAQFYAMNGEDKMAVLATDELEGTPVCFTPGNESNYTISFFGGDGRYYLNDLKEEQSTAIEQGNTYSFTYEQGDMPHRFLISTTPFGIPSVTTGCGAVEAQEKAQKIIYNDHVYIIRGGQIYDVMGKMMK